MRQHPIRRTIRHRMGGSGSGWYRGQSTECDYVHDIDLAWLRRHRHLKIGTQGRLTWSNNGHQTGSIQYAGLVLAAGLPCADRGRGMGEHRRGHSLHLDLAASWGRAALVRVSSVLSFDELSALKLSAPNVASVFVNRIDLSRRSICGRKDAVHMNLRLRRNTVCASMEYYILYRHSGANGGWIWNMCSSGE